MKNHLNGRPWMTGLILVLCPVFTAWLQNLSLHFHTASQRRSDTLAGALFGCFTTRDKNWSSIFTAKQWSKFKFFAASRGYIANKGFGWKEELWAFNIWPITRSPTLNARGTVLFLLLSPFISTMYRTMANLQGQVATIVHVLSCLRC